MAESPSPRSDWKPEGLARRTCYGCGHRRICAPGDASGLDGPSDAPGCRDCLPGAFEPPPDRTCSRCGGKIPGTVKVHPPCRLGSVKTGQFCYVDPRHPYPDPRYVAPEVTHAS